MGFVVGCSLGCELGCLDGCRVGNEVGDLVGLWEIVGVAVRGRLVGVEGIDVGCEEG